MIKKEPPTLDQIIPRSYLRDEFKDIVTKIKY